jgi:hypothetical protein
MVAFSGIVYSPEQIFGTSHTVAGGGDDSTGKSGTLACRKEFFDCAFAVFIS